MITFNFSDKLGQTSLEVRSSAEHMEALVDDFKRFLHHVGYDEDTIERIVFFDNDTRQGLPRQMDMFK